MSDDDRLMTVATFQSLIQAELAQSVLEGEGIRSFLADGETVNMAWWMSGAVGGIKLQVAEPDLLAAERALNSREGQNAVMNRDDYGLPKPTDAITAHPKRVREETPASEDAGRDESEDAGEEATDNDAEIIVGTALRAAVFGLLICPPLLQIYSMWLLLRVSQMNEPLRGRYRTLIWIAAILDTAVILLVITFIGTLLFGGPPQRR